ncbi:DUF4239 domain-containing protein [Ralstonia flaminis]|jgi:hypothetical protein|uniref:DUF4239 domain-containing protein n=1 Tax=Ralstonia flaminis TaxID=3058597 RepID=A0ABN9JR23_9RALS|nr:DUF4239 domain-containing protein [Ralstonia sp. LMG 18101]CAJ0821631.1 hypothetical protein LMG18101_04689 [Ralstonia sp. LMG 18101]
MLFLYNIPAWAMGAVIVFSTLAIALGGYVLFRRLCPVMLDAEQRGMTIAMMTAVTTINSLLVAFSAISVWGAYQAAADIVAAEAACATELAHDLSAFSHPSAAAARRELVTYLEHVVHDEWPSMQQQARADVRTEAAFNRMFATTNRITPSDDRERVLLTEVLARANEMVKYREKRLQNLDAAMPATLWGVMLIASGLSLLLLYALPASRFHMALVAAWATTLGLAFFFVLAVDRPFAGEVSVSPAPIERTIQTLSEDEVQINTTPG